MACPSSESSRDLRDGGKKLVCAHADEPSNLIDVDLEAVFAQ